jgi:hypothetical protein
MVNCSPDPPSHDTSSDPSEEGTGGVSSGGTSTGGALSNALLGGNKGGACSSCGGPSIVQLRVGEEEVVFDEAPGPQGIYKNPCGNPIVLERSWCAPRAGELYALQRLADSSASMGGAGGASSPRAQLNLWFAEVWESGFLTVEAWGNYRDEQGITWIFERRGALPAYLLSSRYGPAVAFSVEFIGENLEAETRWFEVDVSTCAQDHPCLR